MAVTLGVSSLAGCNKGDGHQHAYNWTVDREATCTEQGYRTGTCVCGDAKGEYIPVDPDAHDFDEQWEITKYPTAAEDGRATRTCKYNAAHTFTATLPAITDAGTGYLSSEITVKPTIISTGNRHFVFAHEAGAVEFDIELPKRTQIENIEDVVIYASSLHNNIRSSGGNYVYGDPDGNDVQSHEFSNYYGNNYTRVHDGGNERDFWYSLDENGKPFGISAVTETVELNPPEDPENPPEGWEPILGEVARDPKIDESVTENDLLGFGYASGGGMRMTYGAEDTLLAYYDASQSKGAIKYNSDFSKSSDGSYACWFEFSRKEQTHFCRYRVEFRTFPTGEIKTLSVRTKIIRTFMLASTFDGTNERDSEIIYDSDGDVIFSEIYPISTDTGAEQYETAVGDDGKEYIVTDGVKTKPDGSPLLDKQGNQIKRPVPLGWKEADGRQYYYEADATHPTDHEFIAIRTVNFTQVLKTPEDEVISNPYPAESVYIHSFDVMYGGVKVEEGDTVDMIADASVVFNITNVQPADTAKLSFDPLRVYLKTQSGEIELDYTGNADFNQNAYHIVGNFNATNGTVYIRAQYKGELTIVLRPRGGRCEREIKLNVKPGKPTELTPQAYLYSDAGGIETYTWTDHNYDSDDDIITLYAGQSLYVRALPLASEQAYVDGRFVASVSRTYGSYITTENELTLADGTAVSKITAVKPTVGTSYPVIEFNLDSAVTEGSSQRPVASTQMRIRIIETPSAADLLSGTHAGRFSRIRMVETGNLVAADVTATFVAETENSGKINIRVTDGTNVATCVYGYEYNPETRAFVCTWESGKENTGTFAFDIKINDAFKIAITHPTFEGRSETVVLSKQGS